MDYFIPLIIALIVGSTKEVFKKSILKDIEPIQFIVIFYGVMFIFAQFTISRVIIPDVQGWFLITLSAFFYVLANLAGLRVLKEVNISLIKPLSGLESVVVVLISFFMLKEYLRLLQVIGIIIIIVPLIYLVFKQYGEQSINKRQITLIIGGILFSAITTIIDRIALKTIDPVSYFYFIKLILLIMFIFVLIIFYRRNMNLIFLKQNIFQISSLAIFTMVGTYAYFFALNDPLANTGIIKTVLSTSIIFSAFIGGKYFHESDLKEKIIISSFVIFGISILIFF